MDFIRRAIERQILGLSGVALGQIDFERPPGDPGLYGPEAVCWRVHGDFTSMMVGGIAALLMQALHPLALAGVWEHSNFREDLLGRLRRTGQFISGTTFAARADADALIERVKRIHLRVVGTAPDGRPYAASDPALLTWVHVAEVHHFMAAHLRYRNPRLPLEEQNRYYAEVARVAERLGARDVPRTHEAMVDYLNAMRPQLRGDARSREILRILLTAPAPSVLAVPMGMLLMRAGIDLLPGWAQAEIGHAIAPWQSRLIRPAVNGLGTLLRWAVRNGAMHRAHRRLGLVGRA